MDAFTVWFNAKDRAISANNRLMNAVFGGASEATIDRLSRESEAADAAEASAKAALDAVAA